MSCLNDCLEQKGDCLGFELAAKMTGSPSGMTKAILVHVKNDYHLLIRNIQRPFHTTP